MKHLTRLLINAGAVGAMTLSSIAPAVADDRRGGDHHRGRDGGISAGEIIAGALIIGGIAAIASAGRNNDRSDYHDRRGYGWGNSWAGNSWDGGDPRMAVERCVRTAEREAVRGGYVFADVIDVGDIRRTRYGYEVRGRIAVRGAERSNWDRSGWGRHSYDRDRYDDRGYRGGESRYDGGAFRCRVESGRVVDLDFRGVGGI